MSKISVIVPVYNVEQYLSQCLDSIINQTYKNLEIICVDDGSPDNSGKILDEYAEKDNRIKVIHQENQGVSVARNTGLDNATGEWVSFIDSDDYIKLDFYERMINVALKNNSQVVQCRVYRNQKPLYGGKCIRTSGFGNIISILKRGYSCNKLWSLELINKNNIRFYPGIYVEDILFSVQVAFYANSWETIDYDGYFYRYNPSSITNDVTKKSKMNKDVFHVIKMSLDFVKNKDISPKDLNILKTFLVSQLLSIEDLSNKSTFVRFRNLLGFNKLLFSKRFTAIRRFVFYFSIKKHLFILLGKNLWTIKGNANE